MLLLPSLAVQSVSGAESIPLAQNPKGKFLPSPRATRPAPGLRPARLALMNADSV